MKTENAVTTPSFALPLRFVAATRLGQGGGGCVWAVRCRVTGARFAFKVLAESASEAESLALVREAAALLGVEGLGLPRVVAVGTLPGTNRRYLVREIVEGQSLQDALERRGAAWLRALWSVARGLTWLHRAGIFHGDIKPANIIVRPDGSGTLIDLGLAALWRDSPRGATANGFTKAFAAPELLRGENLTVRGEVYALGATLSYGLEKQGETLPEATRAALDAVAARATQEDPALRYPSVDELASALHRACGGLASDDANQGLESDVWPLVALDASAEEVAVCIENMAPGSVVALVGRAQSGRTTLLRRVSWALGVKHEHVAVVEPKRESEAESGVRDASSLSMRDFLALETSAWNANAPGARNGIVVVDDFDVLDDGAVHVLRQARERGVRLVVVGEPNAVTSRLGVSPCKPHVFAMPPLEPSAMRQILKRSLPSLPEGLVPYVLERVDGRPGVLRALVRGLGTHRAVTSREDIDAEMKAAEVACSPESEKSATTAFASENNDLEAAVRALDTGRFDDAAGILVALGQPCSSAESLRRAVAQSRVALARGETESAAQALDAVANLDAESGDGAAGARTNPRRDWLVARARTYLRTGLFREAVALAEEAVGGALERTARDDDTLASDALSVAGVALAYLGDEARGLEALTRAVSLAERLQNARASAVALGSLALVHQRGGRTALAREAYAAALQAAERAGDAWTLATTQLNLAGLAKAEGALAESLEHFETALDLAKRVGAHMVVQQALFNVANLDLYLGRYTRARVSIERLAESGDAIKTAPSAQAQCFGLQAELAARTGESAEAARFYELSAEAYEQASRAMDAAEARLEGILVTLLAESSSAGDSRTNIDAASLERRLASVVASLGPEGLREHEALGLLVKSALAFFRGDERLARTALDAAYESARLGSKHEWTWRALELRSRLAQSQGASALAMRDRESALALLEETAARLPRDLREVFWNDPRRNALRNMHRAHDSAHDSIASEMPAPSALSVAPRVRLAEDRLARIFEITRDLAREHELERLLVAVTHHAVQLLGAERGLVVLVDEEGQVTAHTARDGHGGEAGRDFSRSVAERVIREGEPVVATNAYDDDRLAHAASVHHLQIQSVACVPIRGAPPLGRTIGALYVETRLRPGLRFREELPALVAFADQAAIAIESARLLEENKRKAAELQTANAALESAKDELAALLGRRTEQLKSARRDLAEVRSELRSHFGYAGLVGTSDAMRKLYAVLARVSDADVPVLVTGESGTGKEKVARAIHSQGPRHAQPFLGVNCGAIPANLLESELFGHVRGAFTGAERDRKGLIREAAGGTLLLDEVGEMPLAMQASLLRVLQERAVRPLGGVREEPFHARLVAATNRDLAALVAAGSFREDLFYRLHGIAIRVPPLRERIEDIPALIDHFFGLFNARHTRQTRDARVPERKGLTRAAIRRLQNFAWPGNVRQLENVLLNAWLLSDESEITEDDLDLPEAGSLRAAAPPVDIAIEPYARAGTLAASLPAAALREAEKAGILKTLEACQGNRVQAASTLGIPRRTFYRRLKAYGLM